MDDVPFRCRFRDSRRAERRSVPTGFGRTAVRGVCGRGLTRDLLIHDHSLLVLYKCDIYSLVIPILHHTYWLHPQPYSHQTIMKLSSTANPYLRTARGFTTSAHLRVPLLLTPKQYNDLPKVSIHPQTVTSTTSCVPGGLAGPTMLILLMSCPYSLISKLSCPSTPHGICPILLARPWLSISTAHAFPMLDGSTWMR